MDGAAVFLGARLAGEGGRALGDGERQFQGAQLHLVALGGHQQSVAARIGGRGVQIGVCGHAIGHGGFLPCVAQLPAGHGVGLNNNLGSVIRHHRAIVDLRLVFGHLIAAARNQQLHAGDRNGLGRKLQPAITVAHQLVVGVVAEEDLGVRRAAHDCGAATIIPGRDAYGRVFAHALSCDLDVFAALVIEVVDIAERRVVLDGHVA